MPKKIQKHEKKRKKTTLETLFGVFNLKRRVAERLTGGQTSKPSENAAVNTGTIGHPVSPLECAFWRQAPA